MTLLEFIVTVFGFAFLTLGWVAIEHLRQILDAQHTLIAQGNQRRQWVKEEHEG